MSSLEKSSYPPTLEDSLELKRLVQTIKDWTIANGLAVRPAPGTAGSEEEGTLATTAPVTLFPSPFPKVCFEEAKAVQTKYNELYARISRDEEFLGDLVQQVAGGDDFIDNLWRIHLRVKEEGYVQNLTLGLFRSDYMVHQDGNKLRIKQVEFNTIASSFGGLSSKTSLLHKHLAKVEYPLLRNPISPSSLDLPENRSTEGLAAGLAAAFHAYGKSALGHPTCVLFLVQEGERNVFDQRHLEYALQQMSAPSDGPIPVFRLPFSQILAHTSLALSSPRRELLYRPPHNPKLTFEVAVAYLRAGYGPSDYPSPAAWEARYQLERSAAIACPSVLTQLAGMKKVQQVLTMPATLHRFIPDEHADVRFAIRDTFASIYPLDDSATGHAARAIATDPSQCLRYVMKPQREGGGNNVYKAAIPQRLASIPEEHWGSYILMELIAPPPATNTILRANGTIEHGGVISELGVYGTCLWDRKTGEVLHNEECGYLLRTKGDQSEEGGVAAGYGCMDSVRLV